MAFKEPEFKGRWRLKKIFLITLVVLFVTGWILNAQAGDLAGISTIGSRIQRIQILKPDSLTAAGKMVKFSHKHYRLKSPVIKGANKTVRQGSGSGKEGVLGAVESATSSTVRHSRRGRLNSAVEGVNVALGAKNIGNQDVKRTRRSIIDSVGAFRLGKIDKINYDSGIARIPYRNFKMH